MRNYIKFLLIFSVVFLVGCRSLNPLYAPSKNMAATILPEYKDYVLKDDKLSAEEKSYRINNAKAFEILVREYER